MNIRIPLSKIRVKQQPSVLPSITNTMKTLDLDLMLPNTTTLSSQMVSANASEPQFVKISSLTKFNRLRNSQMLETTTSRTPSSRTRGKPPLLVPPSNTSKTRTPDLLITV